MVSWLWLYISSHYGQVDGGWCWYFTHEVEIPVLPDKWGHQGERILCLPPDEDHQEDEPYDHETQGDGGRPAVRRAQAVYWSVWQKRSWVMLMGGQEETYVMPAVNMPVPNRVRPAPNQSNRFRKMESLCLKGWPGS